jgi:hypothetical protein
MHNSDRLFFAKFAVDTELESINEYEELCDFDLEGNSDQVSDENEFDVSDEYNWDDV